MIADARGVRPWGERSDWSSRMGLTLLQVLAAFGVLVATFASLPVGLWSYVLLFLAGNAPCCRRWYGSIVPTNITIRDVPDAVHDRLAARATRQHQSMQEFLRAELVCLASRPSVDEWLQTVRGRKAAAGRRVRPRQHPPRA